MMTYEELQEAYPQGNWIRVFYQGEHREVEIVGHKEARLKDDKPAVRVYIYGFGTVLFSEEELEGFRNV